MSGGGGEFVEVTAGGLRWHVAPGCRDRLLGPQGLRLDEWLRAGQARVVKHGPHRTVYAVELPGLKVHVKHNRVSNFRAWLRELIRPSKARLEAERARSVAERGIQTAVPLAVGEACSAFFPGDSFLVTRSLDETAPLHGFLADVLPALPPPRQARVRHRLAHAIGELLARMHAAGIAHPDLHVGNLLVRLGWDDQPHLFLIDLHCVRLGRRLGWPASRANLVLLNRWFALRAGCMDRLRAWRAYQGARAAGRAARESQHSSPPDRRRVLRATLPVRDLERRTLLSNLGFWRRRDRRCLGTNRYFRRLRSGAVVGHAVTDLDPAALAPLLADPDEPFRRPGVTLLKDSRSSTVVEFELPVGGAMCRVIYKRFRGKPWRTLWRGLVRQPPAMRSWIHGHGLRERCLPTARPLAVLHRRRLGLPREGYLLAVKLPDVVDLRRFLDDLARQPAGACQGPLRRRIDQLGRLVRELHQRRLSHRDLKAANILLARSEAAEPACWLIDLVGVTRHRRLPTARRVQNLARLHASVARHPALTRTDKLRFLRVYLRWGLAGRDRWKHWWHAVEQATRAKVARNARNGRPLG